ncbi:MAG: hypothetical protein PUE76_04905 [Bacteroides sp.]|nr:hypothetical protein [Bacteroides sp.]
MELPAELLDTLVYRGQILHSDIFEDIGHAKFFVVIGVSSDSVAGFFYINSEINRFINNKDEQLLMQYPLFQCDYSFLSHDSYICATNIVKLPKSIIVESIKSKRTKAVASLQPEHLDALLQKVRNSRLFSKKEKDEFFY